MWFVASCGDSPKPVTFFDYHLGQHKYLNQDMSEARESDRREQKSPVLWEKT